MSELPVLKADAIKYVMTFRSLLPKDLITTAVPLLVSISYTGFKGLHNIDNMANVINPVNDRLLIL